VEITNTSEVLLSTSTNSSDPNNTVTTNNYEYVFNPSLSTNDCINVIFEMATGNEFYTPQLDFIEFTCGTVIELAGQMNNPTVNLQSDTSNQVTSLLNITTSNINITNAKCYIEFEDFTNLSNAVILKGDLYNSTTSVGPIAQFNYPPTTISPIAEIDFNAGEQLIFQLEHQLVSDVIEELDLVMNCRINNNTIILTRNFKIILD
ncbi:MAG: hypothetical protein KC414_12885, partial [Romboutsia sp.]|nr:hypothetical protein [Romboutsia sp.]